MSNVFKSSRFGKLFIKHTAEHYKSYLMSLTVLIGVMVLGGGFMLYMINAPIDRGFQTAVFIMILMLAGTIFTSTVFADIADKKQAIASLTLPASHFEKFLVGWIYSFLFFCIVYTVSFYVVILVLVHLKHFPGQPPEMLNVFEYPVCQMYLLYAFLHGIAFYGAIFFEKLNFIKTAFAFFISVAIIILMNKIVLEALLGREVMASPPFGNVRFTDGNKVGEINETSIWQPTMLFLVTVLAIIFWVAAYYRLKEKQV
jgi:vacuolar-type H+-ATPase subunit I/STV1